MFNFTHFQWQLQFLSGRLRRSPAVQRPQLKLPQTQTLNADDCQTGRLERSGEVRRSSMPMPMPMPMRNSCETQDDTWMLQAGQAHMIDTNENSTCPPPHPPPSPPSPPSLLASCLLYTPAVHALNSKCVSDIFLFYICFCACEGCQRSLCMARPGLSLSAKKQMQ